MLRTFFAASLSLSDSDKVSEDNYKFNLPRYEYNYKTTGPGPAGSGWINEYTENTYKESILAMKISWKSNVLEKDEKYLCFCFAVFFLKRHVVDHCHSCPI